MKPTLPVHVIVTPELQTRYGVPCVFEAVWLPEPITCSRLLYMFREHSVLKPLIAAAGLDSPRPPANAPFVVASTHHAPDAVILLFSTADETSKEVAVRSFTRGIRFVRVGRNPLNRWNWSEPFAATECPSALWNRTTFVFVEDAATHGVETCKPLCRVPIINMDPTSQEQRAWAHEFFYATLLDEIGHVFVATDAQGVLDVSAIMTNPKILLLGNVFIPLASFPHDCATMDALRACTTADDVDKLRKHPTRRVRVCGYGAIPAELQAAAVATHRDENYDRAFSVDVEVPVTEALETTLRRFLPGAPPRWPMDFMLNHDPPAVSWVPFIRPNAEDDVGASLAFWRTTTSCVLTYLTPFSVVIEGHVTRAGALEAAAEALAQGARFWMHDAFDCVIGNLSTPEAVVDWLSESDE